MLSAQYLDNSFDFNQIQLVKDNIPALDSEKHAGIALIQVISASINPIDEKVFFISSE